MARPLILISNDDGYRAKGLHALIEMLAPMADVIAVAPDGPRSGQSAAITVMNALRVYPAETYLGMPIYACNGTPCDCIKLAMHTLMPRRPDLVLAGINHGSNASVNVIYSGTMGATFEGCACSIPSVGFSLTSHDPDADFEGCRPFVLDIVKQVLAEGLPDGVCLNVNVPATVPYPKEMRVVRAAKGKWSDEYRQYTDPAGHPFWMLAGDLTNLEPDDPDTDLYCLKEGIATVVPVMLDPTAPLGDVKITGLKI